MTTEINQLPLHVPVTLQTRDGGAPKRRPPFQIVQRVSDALAAGADR